MEALLFDVVHIPHATLANAGAADYAVRSSAGGDEVAANGLQDGETMENRNGESGCDMVRSMGTIYAGAAERLANESQGHRASSAYTRWISPKYMAGGRPFGR